MWIPLTPRRCASLAHSSFVRGSGCVSPRSAARFSSARLTNHDTMPGLAPQHDTAVGPPGARRRASSTRFAQRIVCALLGAQALVEVEARPRLGDRVDVKSADLAAQFHDRDRRGVDREIDAEAAPAAFGEQRRQQFAIVLARDGGLDEAHPMLLRERAIGIVGIDDDHALLVEREVAFDQRQGSLADGAEADHHDRAIDAAMHGPVSHVSSPVRENPRRGSSEWPANKSRAINQTASLRSILRAHHAAARRSAAGRLRARWARSPVAMIMPRAPSSAPAASSSARKRSRSTGPGRSRPRVSDALKPKRS